jgi:hypothetical protein
MEIKAISGEGFQPVLELEHGERAQVFETVRTPGFQIINAILRNEVDKIILAMVNTPVEDDSAVLAKHKLAKAAAVMYAGMIERVNEEVAGYVGAIKPSGAPVDPTEGLLDLGDLTDEEVGFEGF